MLFDAGSVLLLEPSTLASPPEKTCPFVSALHHAPGASLGLHTLFECRHDVDNFRCLALSGNLENEPAGVVYGAIVFLLLVGFALLIPTSKWKKWVTGHKQRRDFIAPCDVLAVLVDRPAKLKSSALSALSIGLIPSSSSWL